MMFGLRSGLAALAALAFTVGAAAPATYPAIQLVDDYQMLSPFDIGDPAIAGLNPALLNAIQTAATAAAAEGITMTVTSGWRSPEFQQSLLDDAVLTYGSPELARQYVMPPQLSKHVTGDAVDVGGVGADQWLIAYGARFGLCQIYANELWHFELATDAQGNCPPLLANAAAVGPS